MTSIPSGLLEWSSQAASSAQAVTSTSTRRSHGGCAPIIRKGMGRARSRGESSARPRSRTARNLTSENWRHRRCRRFEVGREDSKAQRSEAEGSDAETSMPIYRRQCPHAARAGTAFEPSTFRLAAGAANRRCAPCRNAIGLIQGKRNGGRLQTTSMSAITPKIL